MPPFFYREASDDGVAAFFDTLLARAKPPGKSVLLYNVPRMSGIALHADLVDRLVAASGDRIFGMKDSSNDARLQAEIIGRRPGFSIFPGSESDLAEAKRRGAAGCISGSVALCPVGEERLRKRRRGASVGAGPASGIARRRTARRRDALSYRIAARRTRMGACDAAAGAALGGAAGKARSRVSLARGRGDDRFSMSTR